MDQVAVTPTHIGSYSLSGLGGELTILNFLGAPVSANWPLANDAIYIPLQLEYPYPVSRVWWVNGATITGTIDVGIYSADGEQLFHAGSTAQAGASAVQYAALSGFTNFILPTGNYYLGMSCSGTTGLVWGSAGTGALGIPAFRASGLLRGATAHPLPTTMGSAVAASTALLPLCGITKTATGF